MGFLETIGQAIADKLLPVVEEKGKELLDRAEAEAEKLLARIIEQVASEIQKHIPALTAALVTAVATAGANFVEDGVNKVTDFIPTQLDDNILDPIVKQAMDIFKGFLPR